MKDRERSQGRRRADERSLDFERCPMSVHVAELPVTLAIVCCAGKQ